MSLLQTSFGTAGLSPCHWARSLWWPSWTLQVSLAGGMQHSVKDAFRTDIETTVCQDRHDLSRRQRRKFRLIAREQHPLALLLAEAVGDVAVAALATIDDITVISELSAPALQRGEPHA
jgi:hypothetical protein